MEELTLQRSSEELWKDYLFLTQELSKFVTAKDTDLVEQLLEQRDRIQALIIKTPDKGFKQSAEGRKILFSIRKENQAVMSRLQYTLNTSKQQQHVTRAYSDTSELYNNSYFDIKSK